MASLRRLGGYAGLHLIQILKTRGAEADKTITADHRARAAKLLGECQFRNGIDALIEAVRTDPDRSVRFYAAEALGLITGEKLIDDPDATAQAYRAAVTRWSRDRR